ncbi:RES family NAD+ phosphorylase [Roseomonas sp. KE0001]|uniref:RES family NAD+ phosphorylase n=1 Tax=Roseomonas sp. KE0001 TaxID=2479201 RepID=UPI0018E03C5F|nr:RES domain-containing protein [Roseomonas sp. KE0001]
MTRLVWRIATDAPTYEADDLSGIGAKLTGGRWNEAGIPLTYAAESRALACLETIVHLNEGGLPLNRYLVEISIPDDVWKAREEHAASALPVGWDARPASRTSIAFGSGWLRSQRSAILVVPSVIVPEETNVLINPQHEAADRIKAKKVRLWTYDPRMTKGT